MLQDAISPDDIIGILDVRENIFLINNFLVEARKISNFDLNSMNIPIDQRDFFVLNKSLGNESYAIVSDDKLEGRYDSPL